MIIVNSLLRIDTYDKFDIAYLLDSADHFRISRAASIRLVSIRLNPESEAEFFRGDEALTLGVKKKLLEAGLVVSKCNSEFSQNPQCRPDTIREFNWRLASEYLARSYDFKFFNYAEDGWRKDSKMMADYLHAEAEPTRYKKHIDAILVSDVYSVRETLSKHAPITYSPKLEDVFQMVAITSGVLRWKPLSQGGAVAHKIVPSGGGRHPTEIYILDLKAASAFHFCFGDGVFERVATDCGDLFFSCFGARNKYVPFDVAYAVIFTCVWARNMFRYREIRTFRSVHMDIGHAICNMEVLCKKGSIKSKVQYGINELKLEKILNLEPLIEGVMCALMIGDRSES